MVDDTPKDNGPASETAAEGGRRPRTPPTIELEASRVETAETAATDASHAGEAEAAGDATASVEPPGASDRPRRAPGLIAAALAGGVGALAVGGAAWFGGVIGNSNGLNMSMVATVETLAARVARLEAVPPPPTTLKTDPVLAARVDGMEKSIIAARDNLATLREQVERTAKSMDDIKTGPPAASAPPPDLSAFDARIAQLDARLQALAAQTTELGNAQGKTETRLADISTTTAKAVAAKPADDVKLRRAIAANALDTAARAGEPLAPVLDAAKRLAADPAALKPLDAFATSGVPSAAGLALEFMALRQARTPPPSDDKGTPATAGWLDRLRTSAEHLVKIRRDTAAGGADETGVLARGVAAAMRGDLAAVKRELASLPEAERARFQPWIDKAAARDAALAAAHQFAANAITALTAAP